MYTDILTHTHEIYTCAYTRTLIQLSTITRVHTFTQSYLHPTEGQGGAYKAKIVDVCGPDEEPIKADTIKVDLHCL